jgi:hypothetical protein
MYTPPPTVTAGTTTPASRLATPTHIKVFATTDAAEKWFEENDPEGVAFEYDILEKPTRRSTVTGCIILRWRTRRWRARSPIGLTKTPTIRRR